MALPAHIRDQAHAVSLLAGGLAAGRSSDLRHDIDMLSIYVDRLRAHVIEHLQTPGGDSPAAEDGGA